MHKCPQEQSPMATIHRVGMTEEKIPADTEFLGDQRMRWRWEVREKERPGPFRDTSSNGSCDLTINWSQSTD